jgi:hypothetical protein
VPAGFEALAERDIQVPDIEGGTCPVSPSELRDPTLQVMAGEGPIFATGLGNQTVMTLLPGPDSDWKVGRVTFMADPEFAGKVLVRGVRAHTNDLVGFGYKGPSYREPEAFALYLDTGDTQAPGAGGWNYFYADARIIEPGCYFFQVDTDARTQTIIFRVA